MFRTDEKNYKILNSNESTINPLRHSPFQALRHNNHVPASPLYDPANIKPPTRDRLQFDQPPDLGPTSYDSLRQREQPKLYSPSPRENYGPKSDNQPAPDVGGMFDSEPIFRNKQFVEESPRRDFPKTPFHGKINFKDSKEFITPREAGGSPEVPPTPDRDTVRLDLDRGGTLYPANVNSGSYTSRETYPIDDGVYFGRRKRREGFEPEQIHDYKGNRVVIKNPIRNYRGQIFFDGTEERVETASKGPGYYTDRPQYYEPTVNHRSEHNVGDGTYLRGPPPHPAYDTIPGSGLHPSGPNGGALLFIRFSSDKSKLSVAAQAFQRAHTRDMGGRWLGMAPVVYDYNYSDGTKGKRNTAISVFHFPTREKAVLFFQYDHNLIQPDFPRPYGEAEMWVIDNKYLPDNMDLFNTFLLSEMTLKGEHLRQDFKNNFGETFKTHLYKNGGMPFVVASYHWQERESIRRHCYPIESVIICHLFQGEEHFNHVTKHESFSKFRSWHNQYGSDKTLLFSLKKQMAF